VIVDDRSHPGASRRPVLLSGIQPSGRLMIGNYLGAIRNWVRLQADHDSLFMLADLHAITVPQEPGEFRRRAREFVALFLACGVDPVRSTVFLQSQVPAHTQLLWILNTLVPMGELQRMTQFKDKAARDPGKLLVGLFDYPVLMAADVLLYRAERVPVGEDQIQHLEFTRELARRFNHRFGEVFTIPERVTPETGARLMSLQNPLAKMSKSDPDEAGSIALLDRAEDVRRKIKTAVTDSGCDIRSDPAKPGISNLIVLYAATSGMSPEGVQHHYEGKGYAEFKRDVADAVIAFLEPIQRRFHALAGEVRELDDILRAGARTARDRSEGTLRRVYDAVGFLPDPSAGAGTRRRVRPRQSHARRDAMQHDESERSEVDRVQDLSGSDTEIAEDCCCCCCCETEEECSMEE
jgi:tryptophanyl-tRNA synthetase